jgi:hypothetical protein
LQPLNLADLNPKENHSGSNDESQFECILCDCSFNLEDDLKKYLAHLLTEHKIVISDVDHIGDLKK